MNEVGETAAVGLSLGRLHRCVRLHLCQALRSEVSKVINLPIAQVNVEMALASLGLDSLMASKLWSRVLKQLGCKVPLPMLLGGSIAELAEHLAGQMSFGGGVPAPAFSPDAAAREQGDTKVAPGANMSSARADVPDVVPVERQLSLSYPMRLADGLPCLAVSSAGKARGCTGRRSCTTSTRTVSTGRCARC